jgi:hypothetical protein
MARVFAVFARRSLGEGGHGTIFIGCRRALPDEALRSRGRGTSLIDGRKFLPVEKVGKGHWRSVAVEVVSEAKNCQGEECLLRAAARVRVPVRYRSR